MSEGYRRLEHIPDGLLEIPAADLHRLFPQPTLIHLPGKHAEPLFVSVLLHGNETSGLSAAQSLLKRQAGKPWPRAVSLFFGNVQAARAGQRRLDGQPDYNRIWPGTEMAECAETRMAQAVLDEMAGLGVFAALDIHNNTGRNPPYSCVERLDQATLDLAALFDPLVIFSPSPKGTQTGAFARLCPSVTLECGQPGELAGVDKAVTYLEACLNLSEIPNHLAPTGQLDLFHALAQVMVREDCSFSFSDPKAGLLLRAHLDRLNFTELPPGTVLGKMAAWNPKAPLPLIALTDDGADVADQFFRVVDGCLAFKKAVMPCMLSLDERVIRQDCLGYLMERISG